VPPPPAGYAEENAAFEDAAGRVEEAMTDQAAADRAHDQAVDRAVGWVPGQGINRNLEEDWTDRGLADLPRDEVVDTARSAGDLAVQADQIRHAIVAEATRRAGAQPGTPAAAEAAQAADEANRLADDAIAAGLDTTEVDLSARAAKHDVARLESDADAAQGDLGRGARDVAQLDALRTRLGLPDPTA
jgi:hypothetical protein